jgi:two-component system sensor histidine kinase KdpD
MKFSFKGKPSQYILSIGSVICLALLGIYFEKYIEYRTQALIQLLLVSILAMLFDIFPVLLAALLSALLWDYFFIPPKGTFQIHSSEDALMLLMYFVIALINAVLTFQIRRLESNARDKREKENAVKLYNTLFNSLSHELRTPIATIIGATDSLIDQFNIIDEKGEKLLLSEIANAGIRLNEQVDNLLNMSRLDAGMLQMKKDWVDIGEIIYNIIERFSTLNTGHIFKTNIHPNLPFFKTDKFVIEQILVNLISNSVKYTSTGSLITISAFSNDDFLEIELEDNGSGFPDSEIALVFDKFYRVKGSKTGGVGLGLSIVKGFVDALSGTVTLENVNSGGARFLLKIPASASYINNLKNE